MEAAAGKKTVTRPVKASTSPEAFPDPADVKHQPAPEFAVLEKKPVVKLPTKPAAGDVKEAAFENGKLGSSELRTEKASEAVISENMGITVHDTESSARDPKSLIFNPQSSILNSQSGSVLLAFAGDPVSLGMIGLDAVGPDLVEARILSLPEPVYPVLSRKRGEEGRVIIQVEISAEGKVLKAGVTSSSSYPRLDSAALKAIQNAAFAPAIEYGVPVESTTKVAYRFQLKP
jgi:protein TonB